MIIVIVITIIIKERETEMPPPTTKRFSNKTQTKIQSLLTAINPNPQPQTAIANDSAIAGALKGMAIGDALGNPLEGKNAQWIRNTFGEISGYVNDAPAIGNDTKMVLLTIQSVLNSMSNHPEQLAQLIVATPLHSSGRALEHTKKNLIAGHPWWNAGLEDSAGTAGPARCAAIGLFWSNDPKTAAYEAALSCLVTHGHIAAIAASAALAAAMALATQQTTLDDQWMTAAAQIAEDICGANRTTERLKMAAQMTTVNHESALEMIGSGPVSWEAIPAAIYCAATADHPIDAIIKAVQAGGDTDTIGSMAGGLAGAAHGDGQWSKPANQINEIEEITNTINSVTSSRNKPPSQPNNEPVGNTDHLIEADAAVHVTFLLDRSGSMSSISQDVIGGYNNFVSEQRTIDSACRFSAAQFDSGDPYEIIHERISIKSVPELTSATYSPRGATPLFDAIGTLITRIDATVNEGDGEEDQIVVIFTDGRENASDNWTRKQIFQLVQQKQQLGWKFIFMGANQDAYAEGQRLGIEPGNIQNFRPDREGTERAFKSVNRGVYEYRKAKWDERTGRQKALFGNVKEADNDFFDRDAF